MNNVLEMREYVLDYLIRSRNIKEPREELKINGSLNYMLCRAFDRLKEEFGEVSRRDIVMLVESWVMAQGTAANRPSPLYDNRGIPF